MKQTPPRCFSVPMIDHLPGSICEVTHTHARGARAARSFGGRGYFPRPWTGVASKPTPAMSALTQLKGHVGDRETLPAPIADVAYQGTRR